MMLGFKGVRKWSTAIFVVLLDFTLTFVSLEAAYYKWGGQADTN